MKRKAVLRKCNASTDARYFPRDFGPALVHLPLARRFVSQRAAENFMRLSPELTGYRVEVLS